MQKVPAKQNAVRASGIAPVAAYQALQDSAALPQRPVPVLDLSGISLELGYR